MESKSMQPISRSTTAWVGLDSRHGRYMFGAKGEPIDGVIEPGQTATITMHSHFLFRSERLFVQRACAPDFVIHRALVGCKLGAVFGGDPIIAEPFAVNFDDIPTLFADEKLFDGKSVVEIKIDRKVMELLGAPFKLPVLQPGLDLNLQVENIGKKPRRFLGALLGEAVF